MFLRTLSVKKGEAEEESLMVIGGRKRGERTSRRSEERKGSLEHRFLALMAGLDPQLLKSETDI